MTLVAALELSHGNAGFTDVLEDTPMDDLFLQLPVEPLGSAKGPRFSDKDDAWHDTPKLDRFEDVSIGILLALVLAQGQSGSPSISVVLTQNSSQEKIDGCSFNRFFIILMGNSLGLDGGKVMIAANDGACFVLNWSALITGRSILEFDPFKRSDGRYSRRNNGSQCVR